MKPWSYSTLEKFETCPRQYHEIKILKTVVEEESEHQLWGKEVHTAIENYIAGGGKAKTDLPEKMWHWRDVIDKIVAMPAREMLTEVPVSLNESFQPVEWESEHCWTRGVIDLLVLGNRSAIVLDWKTGKRKATEQLKLYAAYVFALYPHIDVVHTALVWLKERRIDKATIKREEVPEIWGKFIERAARLKSAFERDSWPERPNGLCKAWCPIVQCQFNGLREAQL